MATIANLAVQLTANAAQFTTGMASATKGLLTFASRANYVTTQIATSALGGDPTGALRMGLEATGATLQNLLGKIPYIGPALSATIGAAVGYIETLIGWTEKLIALFKAGAEPIKDMRKAALGLGMDVGKMGGMTLLFGGDLGAATHALMHFQEKLQEGAQKTEGTEVTFSRIGLNARELARQLPNDAFEMFVDKFSKLQNAGQIAQTGIALFGRQAAEMIPKLMKGKDALAEFQAAANRFGITVSAADANQVMQASKALGQVDLAVQGIKQNIAVGLSPVILELAESFKDVGVNASAVQEWAVTGAKVIAYGAAVAVEAWRGLKVVWLSLKIVFDSLMAEQMRRLQDLFTMLGKLPESMGGGVFRALAQDVGREASGLIQTIEQEAAAGKAEMNSFGDSFKTVDAFFARVQKRAEAAKKAAEMPKLHVDPRLFDLYEKGLQLTQDVMSPFEQFTKQVNLLNEMLDVGAITWETYGRAVLKAGNALGQVQSPKLAGAAAFGTQEAYATVIREEMRQKTADPMERMIDVVRMALEVQKRQERGIDDIARAAREGFFKMG